MAETQPLFKLYSNYINLSNFLKWKFNTLNNLQLCCEGVGALKDFMLWVQFKGSSTTVVLNLRFLLGADVVSDQIGLGRVDADAGRQGPGLFNLINSIAIFVLS